MPNMRIQAVQMTNHENGLSDGLKLTYKLWKIPHTIENYTPSVTILRT